METDCQIISIYGKFVTSQTASFSRSDINNCKGELGFKRLELDVFDPLMFNVNYKLNKQTYKKKRFCPYFRLTEIYQLEKSLTREAPCET